MYLLQLYSSGMRHIRLPLRVRDARARSNYMCLTKNPDERIMDYTVSALDMYAPVLF